MAKLVRIHWPLLVLALALVAACGEGAPRRRSVLVVVADSLRADRCSAYGHARATTPRFDAFAARGARFEHAYAQSAWTLPSVASMLTGLEQELHGLLELPDRSAAADPRFPPTLQERFDAAGYRTVAVMQTPVLGGPLPIKRGFDRYTVLDFSHESLRSAVGRAYDELAAERDEPVLVYLHVTPPHMPYQPPAPFRGRFADEDGDAGVDGSIESCRRIHRAGLGEDHPDVLRLAALYDEHVAFADDALGELIERVECLSHRRDLVVVWTSDHGEAFMEHGQQGHNSTVFEEMLRVPLAIRALDGSLAPRVVGGVASLLDLAPTLVELAGLGPWPHETRGISLAAALRDGAALPERTLTFSTRFYAQRPERVDVAARRGRYKLIESREAGTRRLYDLETDPGERVDVADRHPEVAAALAAEVRSALRDWERAAAAREAVEPDAELDAAERRRREALRELGYADD